MKQSVQIVQSPVHRMVSPLDHRVDSPLAYISPVEADLLRKTKILVEKVCQQLDKPCTTAVPLFAIFDAHKAISAIWDHMNCRCSNCRHTPSPPSISMSCHDNAKSTSPLSLPSPMLPCPQPKASSMLSPSAKSKDEEQELLDEVWTQIPYEPAASSFLTTTTDSVLWTPNTPSSSVSTTDTWRPVTYCKDQTWCKNDKCPYEHVQFDAMQEAQLRKISKDHVMVACAAFLAGHCEKNSNCEYRHFARK